VPELSLGDVLGTNIVDLALIFGLVTLLGQGIELKDYEQFKKGRLSTFILILLPYALLLDGTLSRWDGALMLTLFLFNTARILREQEQVMERRAFRAHLRGHVAHTVASRKAFIGKFFQFVGAMVLLIAGAEMLVSSARTLSEHIGIPEFVIGLFLVSFGTSLPEFTVAMRSIKTHHAGVTLGDLFGSAVHNSSLILGVVPLVQPIVVPSVRAAGFAAAVTLAVLLFIYGMLWKRNRLAPWGGAVLLALYGFFLLLQTTLFKGAGLVQ
jgi:cation:H+ antiporter